MDRRTFLKSAGGLVVFGLAGALMQSDSRTGSAGNSLPGKTPVGPVLRKDISLQKTPEGAQAYYQRLHIFDVDTDGAKFLALADGAHTIDDIAARTGKRKEAADVALFFVTLGQAGYLQNRVEVSIVQHAA